MTARTDDRAMPGLVPAPGRPFGIYIHVPFCATRCGYCDFNTYTPAELGGANPAGWLAAVRTELGMAVEQMGAAPEVHTVFVGGGTSVAAGRRGPDQRARRGAGTLRARPRRRGDNRGQPRVDVAAPFHRAADGGLHAGVVGHAVRGRACAGHAGPRA